MREKALMQEFSVLMGLYYKDNPTWLKECLDSMVNQTVLPTEFIIVQDGPITDALEKVLMTYMAKYPFIKTLKLHKNVGVGKAVEEGMKMVSYEIVARMDADDISVLDRFEKELKYLQDHPEIDCVGSSVIEFEEASDPYTSTLLKKLPEYHDDIVQFSKSRCPMQQSTVMFRKEAVIRAGGYRHFYLVEDYDLFVRMIQTGSTFYNFKEPLTYMRINKDFYKRRGGWQYFKSIKSFKKSMWKSGHINYFQYIKTTFASFVVTLMPNFLRAFIYQKLLRKKKKDSV